MSTKFYSIPKSLGEPWPMIEMLKPDPKAETFRKAMEYLEELKYRWFVRRRDGGRRSDS